MIKLKFTGSLLDSYKSSFFLFQKREPLLRTKCSELWYHHDITDQDPRGCYLYLVRCFTDLQPCFDASMWVVTFTWFCIVRASSRQFSAASCNVKVTALVNRIIFIVKKIAGACEIL